MQKFAISVPVGAWHPFLPQALASLKSQGAGVAVALLDASGDARVKAVADDNADWLAFRRHGPDKGQSDAILEGWANLEGDWLGWLNADDILMPGALAQIRAAHAADPSLEVIYGHSTILDDSGAMTGYHFNVERPGDRLLQAGIISQPSCLFSRAAYDRAGGLNRDLHYTMDWDLWIRLYKDGAKFGFVDAPISMVLWAAGTKTASLNKRRRAELKALISRHAPEAARKAVFRDFAIHAIIDMIWPDSLRQKVIRRLRGTGPSVYGIGADGRMAETVRLVLAHYAPQGRAGVSLKFDGDATGLNVTASLPVKQILAAGQGMDLMLETPLAPGETLELSLSRAGGGEPVYFRRAGWI
ncbi:glycosyltransferase [Hyphomonas sp. WL0036]|uniref:glycosyltransferase n=1 Tax=Hyphomonas sediminis TaxID=2866160 RepID=UPI001C8118E9|nr:glycosyltransferase [Hyphomonas sediminis]MBY9068555.1 glycosyltransferase [Hyphomonas sediminis]